jgi:hypothetical protein
MAKRKRKVFKPSGPIVIVRWLDAYHDANPDADDLKKPGYVLESCGYLVANTRTHIKIAMEVDPAVTNAGRERTTIPKSLVIEYFVINPKDVFTEDNISSSE